MLMIFSLLLIVTAYLIGSFPTAVLVARWFKVADPTAEGSNNPGATNMLRIGGKKVAAITLAGDLSKGVLAVALMVPFNDTVLQPYMLMLAALIGHLWPIFNRFVGGKGVATLIGGLLMLNWQFALFFVGVWLLVAKVLRISSVSALAAVLLTPMFVYWLDANDLSQFLGISIACLLVLMRHKQNIQRLLRGEEG